jgi:hypothetical protein
MAISFVGASATDHDGVQETPVTINIPSHSSGDLLLAYVVTTDDVTPATAINTPSGWTNEEDQEAGDYSAVRLTLFTKIGNGSETTVDITLSGDPSFAGAGVVLAFSGASQTLDVKGTTQSELSVDVTAPSVTTTVENTHIVYAYCQDDDSHLIRCMTMTRDLMERPADMLKP